MRVAVFSTRAYDREFLEATDSEGNHEFTWFDTALGADTAPLAAGHDAVCVFVNDVVDAEVVRALAAEGVRAVALRCAGFNNVDVEAAAAAGITVVRVPRYSPHAVAEHAVGLMLALARHLHRAYVRSREGNYELTGLLGFTLQGKTAGVVGTGAIGSVVVRLLRAFDMDVVALDPVENPDVLALGATYVADIRDLAAAADVVTLHCPLTPETRHLVDAEIVGGMRRGVVLINTGRGALVDTGAVIGGLKSGHIGALGIDVYEEEAGLFFSDHSEDVLTDDVFARLLTFPNVIVTGHQGFFTREALTTIAETTVGNLDAIAERRPSGNEVTP